MAAYKIRGGSWSWSGTVEGLIGKTWDCYVGLVRRTSSRDANGSGEGFGATFEFDGSVTLPLEGSSCGSAEAFPNIISKVMHVRVTTGLGDVDDVTTTTYQNYSSAGTVADIDLDGTWSITLDADLVEEDLAEDTNNSDGFPTYGGTAEPDTQTGIKKRQYLRARVGGTLVCTATIGGVTATATDTITSGNAFDVVEPTLNIGGGMSTSNYAGSLSMPALWQGQGIVGNAGFSHSSGGATANVDSGVSMTTDSSASQSVSATLLGWIERAWSLGFKARALEHEYPSALKLWVHTKAGVDADHTFTGSLSLSGSQKQWEAGATCNGNTLNDSLNEYNPLKMWLDATRLAELEEPAALWRCFQRGRAYSVVQLTHADSYTHTLSSANQLGPTDLVKTFSNPIYLQSYRYMRLRVKADAGGPFTVKIGSKEWNKDRLGSALSAGTTYSWYEIDLCSPTNATASSDTTDTIWPTPTVDGEYWGVTSLSSLTLTGLSATTYYLDANGIELKRNEPTDATCTRTEWCPALPGWIYSHTTVVGDVTTDFYYRRFGLGVTNGRQSLEIVDFIKAVSTSESSGVTTTTYTTRTIENLKTDIEVTISGELIWPGWTSAYAASVDTADGAAYTDIFPNYLNKNRPMCWIYGAGIMYQNGEWSYGFHVDTDDSLTLKAQQLYDSIEWIGGTGDTFNHEASPTTTGAIDLRAGAILSHGTHGILLKTNDLPANDVIVRLSKASGGAARGQGTSDDYGRYRTGLPYAVGTEWVRTAAEGGTSADTVSQPRKRQRVCLRVSTTGGVSPWNLQSRMGMYFWVLSGEGSVSVYASHHTTPPAFVNATVIAENAAYGRVSIDQHETLFCTFERTDITCACMKRSYDYGESWTGEELMITGGTKPTIACDSYGTMIVAALSGGGIAIRRKYSGSDFAPAVMAKDNLGNALQVEDDTFHIVPAVEPMLRWMLHVRISGDTQTSHWACADEEGWTFLRLPD